jgi:hypothetical protein
MLSCASYCQDQTADCARRARLASSPEIAAYCRSLKYGWLRLAKRAQETCGVLGHESGPATLLLRGKPAPCPVDYVKRAGGGTMDEVRSFVRSWRAGSRCRYA